MSVHELKNLTPFAVGLGVCLDRDGRDVAVAVLKATWHVGTTGVLEVAPPDGQQPVRLADEHHGDPGATSVRYASDLVPTRSGTDVAVNGHAYGRGRPSIEVGFRVGALEKRILAHGPRVWLGGVGAGIAGPVGFDRVPVRYELAYGGAAELSGQGPVPYPENPVGVGYASPLPDRSPLPHLEYPDSPFRNERSRPRAAGLGFVPPGWAQRTAFAGTFDEAWKKSRRPLLPADLDERFYNAVPQDQVLRPGLAGGERLVLWNLHPRADQLVLLLPRLEVRITFQVRDREEAVAAVADSLLVEPDRERLAIAYRASLPLGDDVARLKRVIFRAKGAGA